MPICSICNGQGSFSKNVKTNMPISCWLCNGTGKEKSLKEIYPKATLRTAIKKISTCCQCKQKIQLKSQYYDTHEIKDIRATYKICVPCWEKSNEP